MADTTSTQIVAESPAVEAYKLNLMKAAAALQPPTLPQYQIAGMAPQQTAAIELGQQGIGAYAPYLSAANQSLVQGAGNLGTAADIYRGADTRGQFAAGQAAYNAAAAPASQIGQLAEVAGAGYGNIGQGIASLQQGAQQAQQAPNIYANTFTNPGTADAYMSPYMQNVVEIQKREAARQSGIMGTQQAAQAVGSGAFGGSRDAIMRAERERNLAQQMGDIQAQGSQAAYQQAMGQFNAEQQANLSAQQANQQKALAAAGLTQNVGQGQLSSSGMYGNLAGQQAGILGQQSALQQQLGQGIGNLAAQQFGVGAQLAQGIGSLGTQLGNLGTQQAALSQTAQQLNANDVNQLYTLGSEQQKQQQAILDATRASQMQTSLQPYQQLAFQSDIYKGAPSSQMAVSTQAAPAASPFQQIAGVGTGLVTGAAAANKLGLF